MELGERLFGSFFAALAAANGPSERCLARKCGEKGGKQRPDLPLTALQPESGQHKEANPVRLFVLLPLLPT